MEENVRNALYVKPLHGCTDGWGKETGTPQQNKTRQGSIKSGGVGDYYFSCSLRLQDNSQLNPFYANYI